MNGRVKKLSCVVVVAASMLGAGACSRPAENDPVRITGDNSLSNPPIEETTTTEAPEETTTTRFWAPEGPGGSGQLDSTIDAEEQVDNAATDETDQQDTGSTTTSTTTKSNN